MNAFTKDYNNCKRYLQNKVIVKGCRDYDTADQVQEVLTAKNCFSLAENARDAYLFAGDSMTAYERAIIRRAIREDWEDAPLATTLLTEALNNNKKFCRIMYDYRDGAWYEGKEEWYKDMEVEEYAAASTKEQVARERRASL